MKYISILLSLATLLVYASTSCVSDPLNGINVSQALKALKTIVSDSKTNDAIKNIAATQEGWAILSKLSAGLGMLGTLGGALATINTAHTVGSSLYGWMFPSEKHLMAEAEAAKALKIMNARDVLWSCMMKKKYEEKNEDGIPVGCQTLYEAYEVIESADALEETINSYNSYVNRHSNRRCTA